MIGFTWFQSELLISKTIILKHIILRGVQEEKNHKKLIKPSLHTTSAKNKSKKFKNFASIYDQDLRLMKTTLYTFSTLFVTSQK